MLLLKSFYCIIILFLYVYIVTVLKAKQLPSWRIQLRPLQKDYPSKTVDCLYPCGGGQRGSWDSCLSIQLLPPPVVGNTALIALSLREGLEYVGWGRLGEKGLHLWIQGSHHPCWVKAFQVQPFGGEAPTPLQVTLHLCSVNLLGAQSELGRNHASVCCWSLRRRDRCCIVCPW